MNLKREKKQLILYNTSFSLLSCLERYQFNAFVGIENALATAISHACVCKEEKVCVSCARFQYYTEGCDV